MFLPCERTVLAMLSGWANESLRRVALELGRRVVAEVAPYIGQIGAPAYSFCMRSATDAAQFLLYGTAFLRFCTRRRNCRWASFSLARGLGGEHRFKAMCRIVACVPRFGAHRHRRWREVLHLFKVEVKLFGYRQSSAMSSSRQPGCELMK